MHGFRQNASSFKGRTASLAKKLKNVAELIFLDAFHELPFIYQSCGTEQYSNSKPHLLQKNCRKKFAWFLAPDFRQKSQTEWERADSPFDSLQYQQQTGGFEESLAHLRTAISQAGLIDGVLGFSQGAAMAALLCAQERRVEDGLSIRFVILCSGFSPSMAKFERGSIKCPSLHIFGRDMGRDKQISCEASRDLATLFDASCSAVVEHDSGHIIPTRSPYIDEIKDFLGRFL